MSAKCQYQTLPMFGAAPDPPSQADQSRESYEPPVAPKGIGGGPVRSVPAPGVGTRDLSFAMAPTQLSYVRVARRGALQTTVSRASMRSTVVRGVGSSDLAVKTLRFDGDAPRQAPDRDRFFGLEHRLARRKKMLGQVVVRHLGQILLQCIDHQFRDRLGKLLLELG
jgi:hypothetical protein